MATSTFERKIEISPEALEKLEKIISDSSSTEPVSAAPYTQADRDRSEELLRQLLSRSKR